MRRGEEIFSTGHLSRETPVEVGDRLEILGREGIVRAVEPLLEGGELRLVVR